MGNGVNVPEQSSQPSKETLACIGAIVGVVEATADGACTFPAVKSIRLTLWHRHRRRVRNVAGMLQRTHLIVAEA